MVPFDLINMAYLSSDQSKLLNLVNFRRFESIVNSGALYWVKDLKVLTDHLVPFAIDSFSKDRGVAIIILVLTKKICRIKKFI